MLCFGRRGMEMKSELVRLCIEAACESRESVEKWRMQRRSLGRLPSHLADALLRRLLLRRLLVPSLLESVPSSLRPLLTTANLLSMPLELLNCIETVVKLKIFKHCAEEIDFRGENSVDAEWMAYLGAFWHLRYLNVADCHRITSSALWAITGMTSLQELDLSRCWKVNDAGIKHILSITNLEKLHIAETDVTAEGVKLLSTLRNLAVLDLGGLPVTDMSLSSLLVLEKLRYLDLWGSKISNRGATLLNKFSKLRYLNLAWTSVTKLPNLSSLECLNMSNCTIDSIFGNEGDEAPIAKLILSGATFVNEAEVLLYVNTNFLSFLDVSHSCLHRFFFLSGMKVLEHLNLSSCMMGDDSIEIIACIGGNLKCLNLSGTRVSSNGVGILAGHVSNLEILSLSQTPIDDTAISYISMMSSLKEVDLSHTNIKGFIQTVETHLDMPLSLTALQNLKHLERLNLEHTQMRDEALYPLSSFQGLRYLSLKSVSLADVSLDYLSSTPKLTSLSICDAVLTNNGLDLFKPPATLKMMDLRGCWLLTEDAILSFCKCHPQIEVRHELGAMFPFDQKGFDRALRSGSMSRTMQVSSKKGKTTVSPEFIDQRLKYSRDELLALQSMTLPLAFDCERNNAIFEK